MQERRKKVKKIVSDLGTRVAQFIDLIGPTIEKKTGQIHIICSYIQSTLNAEVSFALGLVLVLFGINFMYTFAAFEAFRLYNYQNSIRYLNELWDAILRAQQEVSNNPTTGIQELGPSVRITRVLKAVDPKQVSSSFVGVISGILSALATLRVIAAQAIVVGSSIGDTFFTLMEYYLLEVIILKKLVPKDYQKWVYPSMAYVLKVFGFLLAYFVAKWALTLAICTKGGQLMLIGTQNILSRYGINIAESQSETDMTMKSKLSLIFFTLSVFGLVYQVWSPTGLPVFLKVFFFPLFFGEWFLETFVVA